jgi:hypothetical protein
MVARPVTTRPIISLPRIRRFSGKGSKVVTSPNKGSLTGSAGQRFRVVDVVPFEEEDESPFVGLLQVEGA